MEGMRATLDELIDRDRHTAYLEPGRAGTGEFIAASCL